ncbi:hypothetical protein HDU86_001672, partial [Geranomyces michiganensis]
ASCPGDPLPDQTGLGEPSNYETGPGVTPRPPMPPPASPLHDRPHRDSSASSVQETTNAAMMQLMAEMVQSMKEITAMRTASSANNDPILKEMVTMAQQQLKTFKGKVDATRQELQDFLSASEHYLALTDPRDERAEIHFSMVMEGNAKTWYQAQRDLRAASGAFMAWRRTEIMRDILAHFGLKNDLENVRHRLSTLLYRGNIAVYNNEYMECLSTLTALKATMPVADLQRWHANGLQQSPDCFGHHIEQAVMIMNTSSESLRPDVADAQFIAQMLKYTQIVCNHLNTGTAMVVKEKDAESVSHKCPAAEVNYAGTHWPAKQPKHDPPRTTPPFTGQCFHCHQTGHRAQDTHRSSAHRSTHY